MAEDVTLEELKQMIDEVAGMDEPQLYNAFEKAYTFSGQMADASFDDPLMSYKNREVTNFLSDFSNAVIEKAESDNNPSILLNLMLFMGGNYAIASAREEIVEFDETYREVMHKTIGKLRSVFENYIKDAEEKGGKLAKYLAAEAFYTGLTVVLTGEGIYPGRAREELRTTKEYIESTIKGLEEDEEVQEGMKTIGRMIYENLIANIMAAREMNASGQDEWDDSDSGSSLWGYGWNPGNNPYGPM